ncbi:uncharacterized protein BDV14DRAFT_181823 [Aspergillus stella-maris]|uniref:uncharacterized protein n=1 Tax=Aspergillus stella-maris TaxID=1810926 RepID=UPI003CCDC27B
MGSASSNRDSQLRNLWWSASSIYPAESELKCRIILAVGACMVCFSAAAQDGGSKHSVVVERKEGAAVGDVEHMHQ